MFDILPFPNITGETPEEQLDQINSYLIQLKEELEFILTSISADNLSMDLRQQLASLGADMDTNKTEQEIVNHQIINRTLTVDDVLSSSGFENARKEITDQIPKEYLMSVSEGSNGIVFQTANDGNKVLKVTFDSTTNTISCTLQGE